MKKFILLLALGTSFVFANSLQEIRDRGVVKVGVYDSQPPFC